MSQSYIYSIDDSTNYVQKVTNISQRIWKLDSSGSCTSGYRSGGASATRFFADNDTRWIESGGGWSLGLEIERFRQE